mgnify:CR=1 FL=1
MQHIKLSHSSPQFFELAEDEIDAVAGGWNWGGAAIGAGGGYALGRTIGQDFAEARGINKGVGGLVGGQGTRLRPLTLSAPKPMPQ